MYQGPLLPSLLTPAYKPSKHSTDKTPNLASDQLFLEITPHQELYFLTQMISFCLSGSSLAFLNVTAGIDSVLAQSTAVNFCFAMRFYLTV